MASHALDNFTGTWSADTPSGHNVSYGNAFAPVGESVIITGLRWRRATVGQAAPAALHVSVAGVGVTTAPSVPDDGVVGWQDVALTTPVEVSSGVGVLPYAYWTTNAETYGAYGARGAPPSPVQWADSAHRYQFDSGDVTPGLSGNVFIAGVDVAWGGALPPPPSAGGEPTLTGDLQAWLSTDPPTNLHESDGLPWQTKVDTGAIRSDVADVRDQQNEWAFALGAAAHGYYELMRGLLQTVKDNVDDLPDVIQAIVDALVDHLDSEIGTILAAIDDILSNLGAQSTDLSGTAGSAIGALSARTGFPSTGWTMTAEADFEDAIAFAELADAYVLTIASYQDTQSANESPAGLWLPRLGWWCVLNGSLASQRQFVDFQQMILDDQGRRMPGCAIQLRPGTLATVQAWVLA
jgi:hypothetical protein